MKILVLNPVGTVGGAERVLLAGVAGVRRERPGAVVRVLALGDGPLLAAADDLGCETELVTLPETLAALGDSQLRGGGWRSRVAIAGQAASAAASGSRAIIRLRAAVRRFRPDVVHSHGIKTHLLGRVAVPWGVPLVWHLHDFYSLRPAAVRLLRPAARGVRAGVAISDAVRRDAVTTLPTLPIVTIPNSVDTRQFSPAAGDADLDLLAGLPPSPAGTVRVGLVATYARWKGHLTVLDAAARLAREAPDLPVRWYIIGGPIYRTAAQFTEAELRLESETRGLGGRVGFIPFRSDPAGVYRALDVVVHASTLPEPFGLTIAEAMACGRAVVVSAAGGAAELFVDGVDALGVNPGDPGQLAAAVRRLAEDAELREMLGAAARASAEARWVQGDYGSKLLSLYERVLSSQTNS